MKNCECEKLSEVWSFSLNQTVLDIKERLINDHLGGIDFYIRKLLKFFNWYTFLISNTSFSFPYNQSQNILSKKKK